MLYFPLLWRSRLHFLLPLSLLLLTPLLGFLGYSFNQSMGDKLSSNTEGELFVGSLILTIIGIFYWMYLQNRYPLNTSLSWGKAILVTLGNTLCLFCICLPFLGFLVAAMGSSFGTEEGFIYVGFVALLVLPLASIAVFIHQFSFQEFIIALLFSVLGSILVFLLLVAISMEGDAGLLLFLLAGLSVGAYALLQFARNRYTKRTRQMGVFLLLFIPWPVLSVLTASFKNSSEILHVELIEDHPGLYLFLVFLISSLILWFMQHKMLRPEVLR